MANIPEGHGLIQVRDCLWAYIVGQTVTQLPVELSAYVGGDGGQVVTQEKLNLSLYYPLGQLVSHLLSFAVTTL